MKKLFLVMELVVGTVFVVGCGGDDDSNQSPSQSPSSVLHIANQSAFDEAIFVDGVQVGVVTNAQNQEFPLSSGLHKVYPGYLPASAANNLQPVDVDSGMNLTVTLTSGGRLASAHFATGSYVVESLDVRYDPLGNPSIGSYIVDILYDSANNVIGVYSSVVTQNGVKCFMCLR